MTCLRSGMSLVEVMAAIGANAILAGVAVVALSSLGRADRDVNARLEGRAARTQFAEQLRVDVHAAEALNWDEQNRVLRLRGNAGREIEYRADKSQWSRYVAGSADAEPHLSSAFRLPRSLSVTFDPVEAKAGELVRVHLRSPLPRREGSGEGLTTPAEVSKPRAQLPSQIPPLAPPFEGGGFEAHASRLHHEELIIEVGRDARLLHE